MKTPPAKPKTRRGEKTRRKLLVAAEDEFGEKGYHEASITGITGRAGVGQGTFYIYFSGKEEVLRELVIDMGRMLRQTLTANIRHSATRLEAERNGLEAFFEFVSEHRNLYRIVKESQFIDEDIFRTYYLEFAAGYQVRLEHAAKAGEIRPGYAEERAWAIMGLADFLGMRYVIWEQKKSFSEIADACMDLLENGIKPVSESWALMTLS